MKFNLKSLENEKLTRKELKNVHGGRNWAIGIYQSDNTATGIIICSAWCDDPSTSQYHLDREYNLNISKLRDPKEK